MAKITVLIICLCYSFPCLAQRRERGYIVSFIDMKKYMERRGFKISCLDEMVNKIPLVPLQPTADTSIQAVVTEWLKGMKIKDTIDYKEKDIQLSYTERIRPGGSIFSDLEGTILDSMGGALVEASVAIEGDEKTFTTTNEKGHFRLHVRGFLTTVKISHIGYRTLTKERSNREMNIIWLSRETQGLDAVQVQAYGLISKRLNTGSQFSLKQEDLGYHPGGNLQDGLTARVPGLLVSQPNGVAGSAPIVTLGGRHSIQGNNDMLYVIDGVPLAREGFLPAIGVGSAQGPRGANSFNFLLPGDVKSIEILKDAAATSIYGSRASNGVVLITLKEGDSGHLRLSFDVNYGVGHVVKTSPMLSTAQFLQIRREAILNDNVKPDSLHLPEANYWNSTPNGHFQQLAIGGQAAIWNAGLQATGGSATTRFLLSGQLHRETTVFPGSTSDERRSLYAHIHSQSDSGSLQLNFSVIFSSEDNHLPIADYTADELLAPNAPPFRNATGVAQWGQPPLSFVNIPALAFNDYTGNVSSVFGHVQLIYRLDRHISFEESVGYNSITTTEKASQRLAGQDTSNPSSIAQVELARNQYTHTMTETIGRWKGKVGWGRLEGIAGADWQNRRTELYSEQTRYPNDQSLDAGNNPTPGQPTNATIPYRYGAVFGRVFYDVRDKYLFSASLRRDGSSRLATDHPAGNFWAVGAGWVFTGEPFLAGNRILHFGKLRGSFGTTGNEPMEDYQFAEMYGQTMSSRGFRGQPGFVPRSLANPQLSWELNRRAELAVELEFLEHKLWFSAAAYRSWTANQLIHTTVGPIAGLPGVPVNQQGINVVNKALEFVLQANQLKTGQVTWTSSLVFTLPRNTLARWPGLASTNYSSTYVVGHSLSSSMSYHWTGVDTKTGLYIFQTKDSNGLPLLTEKIPNAGFDPKYYAGWSQRVQWGKWELSLLLDYRRQRGQNPLVLLARQNAPGMQAGTMQGFVQGGQQLSNGPVEWLDHWRKTGDVSMQQRPTSGRDTTAFARLKDYLASDALSVDASYLRLRSISITFHFPERWVNTLKLQSCLFYINGQNLLTLSHFPVTDPETQDPRVLPPLRTVVAGLRLSF